LLTKWSNPFDLVVAEDLIKDFYCVLSSNVSSPVVIWPITHYGLFVIGQALERKYDGSSY
jgi:hypothetical protein